MSMFDQSMNWGHNYGWMKESTEGEVKTHTHTHTHAHAHTVKMCNDSRGTLLHSPSNPPSLITVFCELFALSAITGEEGYTSL